MAPLCPLVGTAALLLLGGPGLALTPTQAAGGSTPHSLRFFYTTVLEPGQGLPQFIAVAYLDNQPFYQYDSNSRKVQPRVPWMEKADAHFWDTRTQITQSKEAFFKSELATLRNRHNRSEEFHTWQNIEGCELRKDGNKEGYVRYAYNGRDFISFDKEARSWTAAIVPAQPTKRRWDQETSVQYCKVYLEEKCIDLLKKLVDYGKEILLRREPPLGKVTRKAVDNGQETLICQAHGFYPREIEVTWRKGEEILEHETFRKNIASNSDGTYYIWLSIEIDPKERYLYRCHVDHASLPKPLVLAFEDPDGVNLGHVVGAILGVIVVVLLAAAGITFFIKKRREMGTYQATSTSDKSSDSSTTA